MVVYRYIAASGVLGVKYSDTSLEQCHRIFVTENGANTVINTLADGFSSEGLNLHDASYDAYVTGCVFAVQLSQAAGELSSCKNWLFMMQSLYHMSLDHSGPEGFMKYEGAILYVTEFAQATKNNDVIAPFLSAGHEASAVEVIWIDDLSLFVCVNVADADADHICASVTFPKEWNVVTLQAYIDKKNQLVTGDKDAENGGGGLVTSFFEQCRSISSSLFGGAPASPESSDSRAKKRRSVEK